MNQSRSHYSEEARLAPNVMAPIFNDRDNVDTNYWM